MIHSPYILFLMQWLMTTSMQLQLEDAPKKVGPLPKLTSDSKREEAIKLYGSGLLYEKENRLLDALRVFDLIYVLTSNNRDTITMSGFVRQEMIDNGKVGYGSAAATVLFLVVGLCTFLYMRFAKVKTD